jgi:hypothetical protein
MDPLEQRLDAVLSKTFRAPSPTSDFRSRLVAAIARTREPDGIQTLRTRLEREYQEQLAELRAGYVRMRRRTLAAIIGGAFAAGAGSVFALPWLTELFGAAALFVLAVLGASVGLAVGLSPWGGHFSQ